MLSFLLGCVVLASLNVADTRRAYGTSLNASTVQEHLNRAAVQDPSSERNKYMDSKLEIERSVVQQFLDAEIPPPEQQPLAEPKVAFLFMTMRDLLWPKLWDAFFTEAVSSRGGRKKFSIYVHQAATEDVPELPLKEYGAIAVPWVKTSWCALFGAEVAMLHAALQDKRNKQFVFVSDSTVPLKSFNYVWSQLAQTQTTSKFCLATPATHTSLSREMLYQEAVRGCVFKDWLHQYNPRTLKHHQWIVLARRHAVAIVKHASEALDVYEKSWRQAAPDVVKMGEGCSDEGVPIAALLLDIEKEGRSTGNTWADLTRMGVEQQCLTYLSWRNCFTDTELDHDMSLLRQVPIFLSHGTELYKMIPSVSLTWGMPDVKFDYDFLASPFKRALNGFPSAFESIEFEHLQTIVKQGFMFARKFDKGAMVVHSELENRSLDDVLPSLWKDVDEETAQHSVWSRLETVGKPSPLGKP
eukprot:TRINITY_DN73019_c0_g1_i1.p1 TRINITY_DN73019_c0_g1~~TRINITY_DN73019_c0_g1_i1.p1  ORF type:complete len:491 (-),score=84.41 TRINITY_DN73019_c0_g1_i1:194-1600(-)